MTTPTDGREWGSTERGFLLFHYLLLEPRTTTDVQNLLGYRGYSGAANLLTRMRAQGLVRDDDGFWSVVTNFKQ